MIGRWRITEADLWDLGHLDLVEPAMMVIGTDGHGEIAFDALQAGLDLGYSQSIVHFTWTGHEEMDAAFGDGHAEMLDDSTIEITFAYHNGDEALLNANVRLLQQAARAPHSLLEIQFRARCGIKIGHRPFYFETSGSDLIERWIAAWLARLLLAPKSSV